MTSRRGAVSWWSSPPPGVAVEIGARRVTAVALSVGSTPTLQAHATEPLADGLVVPSLTGPNITDGAAVAAVVRRTLEAVGGRARRVALVVPDGVAKVSLVKFDKLPASTEDLDQLVRWQVKKSVPFPLEQAVVSWARGSVDAGGATELIVTVARRDAVAEYEAACAAAGVHAGIVDISTFNMINAVRAADAASATGAEGDWLLVHVAPDSSTLAILRGDAVILFRNRPSAGEGGLADLVHQSAMYFEDRLGGQGLARVVVVPRDLDAVAAAEVTALCRSFEAQTRTPVLDVDPRPAAPFSDRISPAAEILRAVAAPVGVLLRERVA